MAKEYIEREAALTAQNKSMNLAECRKRLERLPAANVVEVVRCRECRHADPYGLDLKCNKHSGSTKNKLGEEIGFIEWHTPHFFCADGEMRNGTREIPCNELVTDKYVGRKCKPCKPTQPECGCCEFVESGGAVMDGGQDDG